MKCKKCGTELLPDAQICYICGTKVENNDFNNYNNNQPAFFNNSYNNQTNNINNNMNNNFNNNNNINNYPNPNMNFIDNNYEQYQEDFSYEKPKKISIWGIILILIIIALIGVASFFLISKFVKGNNNDNNTVDNSNNNSNNDDNVNNEETPVLQAMNLDGYSFTIPNGYTAEIQEDCLVLLNTKDKVQFILAIYLNSPYQTYLDQKDKVKEQWALQDYQISGNTEKQIGNANWLIFDAVHNNKIVNIIYRDLGNDNTAEIIILNEGSHTNEELYNLFEDMISNSTYTGNPEI